MVKYYEGSIKDWLLKALVSMRYSVSSVPQSIFISERQGPQGLALDQFDNERREFLLAPYNFKLCFFPWCVLVVWLKVGLPRTRYQLCTMKK